MGPPQSARTGVRGGGIERRPLVTAGGAITSWLVCWLLVGGCASYTPPKDYPRGFRDRAETQSAGDLRVSAVVLSAEEGKQVFRTSLAEHHIQPLWLEIENRGDHSYILSLLGIDRDYFAPGEAAWRSRKLWERRSEQKIAYFYQQHIPVMIPPQETVSGFVYTNRDPGAKAFTVQLVGEREMRSFDFVLFVPGFKADFMRDHLEALIAGLEIEDLDLDGFPAYLESLPCCVLGGDRATPGDPLNLVMVGEGDHVMATLIRRGWDFTETLTLGNAWRTVMSSVLSREYRTAPVSPLYLFGRPQDAAFQKTRDDVDERNHLRLWRAPVNVEGTPVWVGQISRDIGIKLSGRTLVTHKIDPVVDEARFYLQLDIMASEALARLGFVAGVGAAPLDAPRYNYTQDPYYTDGLRLVLFLSEQPVASDEIELLEWAAPAPSLEVAGSSDDAPPPAGPGRGPPRPVVVK